mmetsp:Transcript_39513/g.113685  ORF Transcript_39513/g.113685 Transcript_39513/m.113685 type:complete len:246 (-) Transcript_39513:964-1701(-)
MMRSMSPGWRCAESRHASVNNIRKSAQIPGTKNPAMWFGKLRALEPVIPLKVTVASSNGKRAIAAPPTVKRKRFVCIARTTTRNTKTPMKVGASFSKASATSRLSKLVPSKYTRMPPCPVAPGNVFANKGRNVPLMYSSHVASNPLRWAARSSTVASSVRHGKLKRKTLRNAFGVSVLTCAFSKSTFSKRCFRMTSSTASKGNCVVAPPSRVKDVGTTSFPITFNVGSARWAKDNPREQNSRCPS